MTTAIYGKYQLSVRLPTCLSRTRCCIEFSSRTYNRLQAGCYRTSILLSKNSRSRAHRTSIYPLKNPLFPFSLHRDKFKNSPKTPINSTHTGHFFLSMTVRSRNSFMSVSRLLGSKSFSSAISSSIAAIVAV